MVNTLLQRFSYLLTDDEWREELDPEHVLLFGRMATFLREIASETDRESRRDQNGADASGSDDSSGRAGTHFLSKYAAYPDSDPEDGRRGNAGYPEDSQSELEGAFPADSDKVLPGVL